MKARRLLGTILLLLAPISVLCASNVAELSADSLRLSVGVEATTFFRNNEYHADYQLGYTLPGWQLAPTVALEHRLVRLVGGVYNLTLLGAQRYPRGGWYDHLPHWSGDPKEQGSGVHLRPILSLQYRPNDHITVSMGTLLGAQTVALRGVASSTIDQDGLLSLVSPLYDPEYSFTRDPAQGAMIQLRYPRFALEALVDWQGFIFPGETHQEAFSALLFTAYQLHSSDSWKTQLELQATAHHRAGEIQQMSPPDTLHTYLAGATGVTTQYKYAAQGAVEGSLLLLGSSLRDGKPEPPLGYGFYGRLAWRHKMLRLATDATYGHRYYAPYGGPLLASARTAEEEWRLGLYPALEVPIPSFGALRLEGALWWSQRTATRSQLSHMISLTLTFCNNWTIL